MLRRGLGASLLHALNIMGGYIGLPEVVEREIIKQLVLTGLRANEVIKEGYDSIGQLTGSVRKYWLPTEDELKNHIVGRLNELDKLFQRVPFTLDHAKSALDRVNSGLPPNGPKNQQFKDSAIWEAILDLSRSYKIHFVTEDNGFFKGREPKKGLAENLLRDCAEIGAEVTAYNDLSPCLELILEKAPPLDHEEIALAIDRVVNSDLSNRVTRKGFELGEMSDKEISHFPTANFDLASVKFKLTYKLSDVSQAKESERIEASLFVIGDCSYDVSRRTALDILLDSVEYRWQDLDGEIHKSRDVFVRVHDTVIAITGLS